MWLVKEWSQLYFNTSLYLLTVLLRRKSPRHAWMRWRMVQGSRGPWWSGRQMIALGHGCWGDLRSRWRGTWVVGRWLGQLLRQWWHGVGVLARGQRGGRRNWRRKRPCLRGGRRATGRERALWWRRGARHEGGLTGRWRRRGVRRLRLTCGWRCRWVCWLWLTSRGSLARWRHGSWVRGGGEAVLGGGRRWDSGGERLMARRWWPAIVLLRGCWAARRGRLNGGWGHVGRGVTVGGQRCGWKGGASWRLWAVRWSCRWESRG